MAARGTGDLAVRLSDLARSLHDEPDVRETLDAIVAAAVGTVPGVQHAGVMVVEGRRRIETRAATSDLVRRADQAQFETGEGPCLDAIYRERTFRLTDLVTERRWPRFARRGAGLGIRSMLSLRIYIEGNSLGALNLYSEQPNAFDDDSASIGELFATHAAVALRGAQQQEQLDRAVTVRDLIGQAKGILMERHRVTADQAFGLLVRASQRTNTKLIDVARHLADTGELQPPTKAPAKASGGGKRVPQG